MTQWQESCITALASSPFTWEAFKMKQRNKNLLWQYINRIWPYHRIAKTNIEVSGESEMIQELKRLLKYLNKFDINLNNHYEFPSPIDFTITTEDWIIITTTSLKSDNIRNICNTNGFNATLGGDDILSGSSDIIKSLSQKHVGYNVKYTCICGSLAEPKEQIKNCIHGINLLLTAYTAITGKTEKTKLIKKNAKAINWLNVGIEIEHDAQNETSKEIVKRILQQNCKEYDSGFDGNSNERLRENRIRLNGIKGLKGLYTLLQDMQENAAIARSSSVHMHIDCKFDDSYYQILEYARSINDNSSFTPSKQIFVKTILNNKILQEFTKIFDLRKITNIADFSKWVKYNTIIRFNDEFNTIEYRFCIPNFNYSDYVIQILFLIHITECIKHHVNINKNYVTLLTKIINKLRNND